MDFVNSGIDDMVLRLNCTGVNDSGDTTDCFQDTDIMDVYCRRLFSKVGYLQDGNYSIALVDMEAGGNGCGLMVAHLLEVPVVGYMGGGILDLQRWEFETPSKKRSSSGIGDLTYFNNRLRNAINMFLISLQNKYIEHYTNNVIKVSL